MVAFQFNKAVVGMAHPKKMILPEAFLPNQKAFFPDAKAFFPVLWFYTEFSQRITYQIRIIFVHLMKIVLCWPMA